MSSMESLNFFDALGAVASVYLQRDTTIQREHHALRFVHLVWTFYFKKGFSMLNKHIFKGELPVWLPDLRLLHRRAHLSHDCHARQHKHKLFPGF